MDRLTYNPCDECPYGIDRRDGSGNGSMCKICEFKAQQQEIDRLKGTLQKQGDSAIQRGFLFEEVNLDNVRTLQEQNQALTLDKDEQAGRIMRMDTLLKECRKLFPDIKDIFKDVAGLLIESKKPVAATAALSFITIIDSVKKKTDALLGGAEDRISKGNAEKIRKMMRAPRYNGTEDF